jgi:hypothetical protein
MKNKLLFIVLCFVASIFSSILLGLIWYFISGVNWLEMDGKYSFFGIFFILPSIIASLLSSVFIKNNDSVNVSFGKTYIILFSTMIINCFLHQDYEGWSITFIILFLIAMILPLFAFINLYKKLKTP